MTEKDKKDIEDAEIVSSDGISLTDKSSSNRNFQLIFIYGLIFFLFLSIFGLVFYYERKLSDEIAAIKGQIKSLPPVVSSKTIDKRLADFESSARTTISIVVEDAVEDIEDDFNKKIDVLSADKKSEEAIKALKKDLSQLKFDLKKDISDSIVTFSENTKPQNVKVISELELQSRLDYLKENFNSRAISLTKRLEELEKEFVLSKIKLADLGASLDRENDKYFIEDMKSLKELEENFTEIAYTVLKREAKNDIGGAPWSLVYSTLKSIFVFRSTAPKEGTDTDAVLSRAEHELAKGNFEACLTELSYLDKNSSEMFFEWKMDLKKFMNKTD